jgi:hypothetical protein
MICFFLYRVPTVRENFTGGCKDLCLLPQLSGGFLILLCNVTFQMQAKFSFPFMFPYMGWQQKPEHSLTSPPADWITEVWRGCGERVLEGISRWDPLLPSISCWIREILLNLGILKKKSLKRISLGDTDIIFPKRNLIWKKITPDLHTTKQPHSTFWGTPNLLYFLFQYSTWNMSAK